jgi:hypothetical protein
MTTKSLELKDLIGKHMLTAVSKGVEPAAPDCYCPEGGESISFTLDGVTYMATEDPDDGYRSMMREIKIVDQELSNKFPEVEVMCTMRYREDILDVLDASNGKIILSVGTDDSEDYYPWWVAEWVPENMACNRKDPK